MAEKPTPTIPIDSGPTGGGAIALVKQFNLQLGKMREAAVAAGEGLDALAAKARTASEAAKEAVDTASAVTLETGKIARADTSKIDNPLGTNSFKGLSGGAAVSASLSNMTDKLKQQGSGRR